MLQLTYNEENLLFLKEKISSIRFAIFRADINSALQLPNNIIQALKVEDDGTIWFFTSCTGEHAATIARSFYAYLDFYKKGTDCHVKISGMASIVEDDEVGLIEESVYSKKLANRIVLVKMKIATAEYFENKVEAVGSLKDKVKTVFNQLFLSTPHRVYNFS